MRVCILNSQSLEWQSILPASISVFGSREYAQIYEEHTGYPARLFVAQSDNGLIAYPFFLRPIQSLRFAQGVTTARWDTLTPEYTGPLWQGECSPELITFFTNEFSTYCKEEGIVAEFAHLHPWHALKSVLLTEDVVWDREIVVVDTTSPGEELWERFTYACRKNIKRSQNSGIQVSFGSNLQDVEGFYRIYVDTMNRRQAVSKYYFSLKYFIKFFETLPNNAHFVIAKLNEQIIAATLYLHDNCDVYSYLGGADREFQQFRPTNAVVYSTILWACSQGKKRLILGGGYKPNDGIFQFKASFSPLRAQFYVYRHIHLPDEYAKLCRAWSAYYKMDTAPYFPLYRYIPESEQKS